MSAKHKHKRKRDDEPVAAVVNDEQGNEEEEKKAKKKHKRFKEENGFTFTNRRSNVKVSRDVVRNAESGPIVSLLPEIRHKTLYPAMDLASLGRLARTCKGFAADLSRDRKSYNWVPMDWRRLVTHAKYPKALSTLQGHRAFRCVIRECIQPSGYLQRINKGWSLEHYYSAGGTLVLWIRDENSLFPDYFFYFNDLGMMVDHDTGIILSARERTTQLDQCRRTLTYVVQNHEALLQRKQWEDEAEQAFSTCFPTNELSARIYNDYEAIRDCIMTMLDESLIFEDGEGADTHFATLAQRIRDEADKIPALRIRAADLSAMEAVDRDAWIAEYMHREHPSMVPSVPLGMEGEEY